MAQETTIGDEYALDAVTVAASDGYSLTGSTVRVLLFVGRWTEPTHLITYEPAAPQVAWNVALDGLTAELAITIDPEDWATFAPANPVELRVRVEVTGAGVDVSDTFGPVTLRLESVAVEPDAG